jgi:hypothetical protein
MREGRTERGLAVQAKSLRNNCDNSHGNANNTVLEDTSPNNLHNSQRHDTPNHSIHSLTLNHVNPLRGFRQMPRSPPQHLANQVNGQSHALG